MLRFLVLLLFSFSVHAAECELQPSQITHKELLGTFSIEDANEQAIRLSHEHGDLTHDHPELNFDTLYEVSSDGHLDRFRMGEMFVADGSTYFGNVVWERGSKAPSPGRYQIYSAVVAKTRAEQSIAMVGDSITWWSFGRFFRCLMAPELPGFAFKGPHTDQYGYEHAGEGGNTTTDVLQRLTEIGAADYYFVLIGTNDWQKGLSAEQTFQQIRDIAMRLSADDGTVIVSTLLPRLDIHQSRNDEVNALLRNWVPRCRCVLVDLDEAFRANARHDLYWDQGVHPNVEGYQAIAPIVARLIRDATIRR